MLGAIAGRLSPARRDLLYVLGAALAARAAFLALTASTYDYDEFVLLTLARDWANGAIPYRDFMFFHPPGALESLRILDPITSIWWPSARMLSLAADLGTTAIVWRLGTTLGGRPAGIAAGLLYAVNPLAVVSAARVGQDPLMTLAGMAGLLALVAGRSRRWAAVAGVCLGIAIWIKYPALYFLPIYVLASPRRAPITAACAAACLGVLAAPFAADHQAFILQTVTFQRSRYLMDGSLRVWTTVVWWMAVNPLAIWAIIRRQGPLWPAAGYLLGAAFALNSQVYYHYFVPVVPIACLLSAPLASSFIGRLPRLFVVGGLVLTLGWAAVIDLGGRSPLFVTAARLSDVDPAVAVLERNTRPGGMILADRYEYVYLADRQALAHYFWNIGPLVDPHYLTRRLANAQAVVLSSGASSGYPAGVIRAVSVLMHKHTVGDVTVWTRK